MAPKRLTDILKDWGLLDAQQEARAVAIHRQWGLRIGEVLVKLGFCTREKVLRALAAQAGLQAVDLRQVTPEPRAAALVPHKVALRHKVLPLSLGAPGERVLIVAMAAPVSAEALEAVRAQTERLVMVFVADDSLLGEMISRVYGPAPSSQRFIELQLDDSAAAGPDTRPPLLDIPLIAYLYGGVTV